MAFTQDGKDLDVFFMSLGVPAGPPWPAPFARASCRRAAGVVVDRVARTERRPAASATSSTSSAGNCASPAIRPGGNPLFQLAFLNAADAPEVLGLGDVTSFYLLSVRAGARRRGRGARPRSGPARHRGAARAREFADATARLVNEGFLPVVGALVAIGFLVGGAVIGLTTYTATIEKARDFGVLKALGASDGFLYRIVVQQSLIVGVAGRDPRGRRLRARGLADRAARAGVRDRAAGRATPPASSSSPCVVSLVAAYLPVRRINRIDPAIVFRA